MADFRFENFYDSEEKVIFKGQPSMATYPITEAFFFGMILIIIMLSPFRLTVIQYWTISRYRI